MTTRCTGQTADQYINRLATVGLQGQYRLTAVTMIKQHHQHVQQILTN